MLVIYLITILLILLYLIYPIWLRALPPAIPEDDPEIDISGVSLILLSFNGNKYIRDKIGFLLNELGQFRKFELIIIDDNSSDGSKDFLRSFNGRENVTVILKDEQKGIPHSMNTGVETAKYDSIIFCDQRQDLPEGILKKIVEPLKNKNTGAVSACISHLDKEGCCSWIRKWENFIKSRQSRTGSLIGVYGPLYAMKKRCYTPIPDGIVLDDLYLSLRILRSKQVVLKKDCLIRDEDFSSLNNMQRAKRYLSGFSQIISNKELMTQLSNRQVIMLLWHKYLRLFIPVFLFLSYMLTGFKALEGGLYLVAFIAMSLLILMGLIPNILKTRNGYQGIISINIYYLVSLFTLFLQSIVPKYKKDDVHFK